MEKIHMGSINTDKLTKDFYAKSFKNTTYCPSSLKFTAVD